jgi:hypothetical protein
MFRAGFGSSAPTPVFVLLLAASTIATAQMPGQKAPGPPPAQIEQTSHGIHATAGSEVLEITVCSDSVIHVVASPELSAPLATSRMLKHSSRVPGCCSRSRKTRSRQDQTGQLGVSSTSSEATSLSVPLAENLCSTRQQHPRTYEPVEFDGDHHRAIDRFFHDC